ncbi:MAG: hypothetical protein WCC84_16740 [Candidatus Cybelea sp.]
MKPSTLNRYALTISSAAFLAACGGSQPPIGAPGAAPQIASGVLTSRDGSRTLLYVATSSKTYILTYPGYKKVGTLNPGFGGYKYLTTDTTNGNVLEAFTNGVFIYPHGGTNPIATISEPSSGVNTSSCAVDPTTDNIAVDWATGGRQPHAWVAIYKTASSSPTNYSVPNINNLYYSDYDARGDLFVDGTGSGQNGAVLAELAKGGKQFIDISLDETLNSAGVIRWDGSYITIKDGITIYQLQVSGSTATVVGESRLTGLWDKQYASEWIQGKTAISPHFSGLRHFDRDLGFWLYPSHGRAYKVIKIINKSKTEQLLSVTVSRLIEPSRSRVEGYKQ